MSYARWGIDSDVYVFHSVEGVFVCCACRLHRVDRHPGFESYSTPGADGMVAHMREHETAGHKVPAGCIEGLLAETNKKPESRTNEAFAGPVPTNLGECFDMLKEMASGGDLEMFCSQPAAHYHRSLGMHIRNNWGLWGQLSMDNESGIEQKTLLCVYMEDLGLSHADDMSGLILESFRRHLRGELLDVEGQVKRYQEYWAAKKDKAE